MQVSSAVVRSRVLRVPLTVAFPKTRPALESDLELVKAQ